MPELTRSLLGTEQQQSPTSMLLANNFTALLPPQLGGKVPPKPSMQAPRMPPPADLPHRAAQPFTKRKTGDSEEKLLRKMNGILNKLTPEKYDRLLEQMNETLDSSLALMTDDVLSRIIAEIHDRSLKQPNYCDVRAIVPRCCKAHF
jgi:hypothetical protein